jgi:hypothetical protein
MNSGLSANGGSGTYSWSASGLPAGMEIDAASGVISGVPIEGGDFSAEIIVTDTNNGTVSVVLPLTINLTYATFLTDLSVGSAVISPVFNMNTMAYKVTWSDVAANYINITATRYDVDSELTIAGYPQPHELTVTQEVYLNNGVNLIPVTVSSANAANVQQVYIISVNGFVNNSDLQNLSLSNGNIVFDAATTSYYVNVGSDVTSIDLTAAASDTKAVMLLNGAILPQDGTMSIPLSVGENTITLMVVAQDATTKTYTITVNRGTSDATLNALALSSGTLSPSFDASTYSYTATVSNSVTSLTVTPTTNDSGAAVAVNGNSVSTPVSLSVGSNTVTVKVTGSDGVTTKTYTISVTRETAITVATTSLPIGIVGASYSKTLSATGGSGTYTWSWEAASGSSLPANIDLGTGGTLSLVNESKLTESDVGSYSVIVTATDSGDASVMQTASFTLTIRKGCGNGAYLIESDGDASYTGSYTDDGIPTLTVNTGYTGFTYFGVNISAVDGHTGTEVCVFVQIRNGQQIAFSFNKADYDTVGSAGAGFNVKPGDIIEVYLVDSLSNSGGSSSIL